MTVILTNFAGLLVLALVAIVGFAALKPDAFEIRREAVIGAPPERVFALINDFANWPKWSPWQDLDPNMRQTLSGPPSGVGAVSNWEGNSKVGAGRTEITEVLPPSNIKMQLSMFRPMKAENQVEYMLSPVSGGTRVTWAMRGTNNIVGKIFSIFVDCDKMIGKDFEKGLANLKKLVESGATSPLRAG